MELVILYLGMGILVTVIIGIFASGDPPDDVIWGIMVLSWPIIILIVIAYLIGMLVGGILFLFKRKIE